MARRRWHDLSGRQRKVIVALGVCEGILKTAALIDLKRRAADEVRGPKKVWALAIVFTNSVGAVPAAYFVLGRRRDASA